MALFILGLTIFFVTHFWTAFARGPRGALVGKIGEMGYKAAYSILAAIGFALIIIGWKNADASLLYAPPAWARHVTYLLVLLSFISLAAAYLPKGHLAPALKHPMLAGVKLWAAGHLLANGEVRSVILFGAFLAFAVVDRIAVKKRAEPAPQRGPVVNDFLAIAVGAALWALIFFYGHRYVAGVSLR